ncbi:response regulator [Pedosphaera parvula]|uniref:Response regulator receiver protein n=1 Tax=Pedosphaera parvula (strain Ellin514) TaxID=320771 RepID=B9XM64_PEDPL|nr:response regulator [Pedosphaera parvula]EEF59057.1 response regulator receiver protein [Pedosphaera parvula Ellin514]
MPQPIKVIVADDDEEDRLFLRECLHSTTNLRVFHELSNGSEVIDYLSGKKPFEDRNLHPFPEVLILDAIMPAIEANEILHWIKGHPVSGMKTIVFSGYPTSNIGAGYIKIGAHAFFYKTSDVNQLKTIAREIETLVTKASH